MPGQSSDEYRFGDLLALARQSWVAEMDRRLSERGYDGYRRSDAAAIRLLRRGPLAIGQLGSGTGISRQAARKIADGLEQRGYAATQRDERDSRQVNITLTQAGQAYAGAVSAVISELNSEVRERCDPAQLEAADAVLRVTLFDDSARERAARIPPP